MKQEKKLDNDLRKINKFDKKLSRHAKFSLKKHTNILHGRQSLHQLLGYADKLLKNGFF